MEIVTTREENAAALSVFQDTCYICRRQQARYACPRCGVRYCRLDCYRSEEHLECSETFYRENVLGELQSQQASDQDKLKMLDILKHQMQEQANGNENSLSQQSDGEEEEEDVASLAERFADVELDTATTENILDKLTAKEKAEFEQILQSESAAGLVELWTAWWDLPDVSDPTEMSPTEVNSLPSVPEVTPFASLYKARPSEDLPCNLVNILFAYCLTTRLYNGDHHFLPSECSESVLAISSCLSSNSTYSTVETGLRHAVACAQQSPAVAVSLVYCVAAVHDIHTILKAAATPVLPISCTPPAWRALADLHRILDTAYRLHRKNSKQTAKPQPERVHGSSANHGVTAEQLSTRKQVQQQLLNAQRKVYFFLSWSQTPAVEWSLLADSVRLQHEYFLDELDKQRDEEKVVVTHRKTKPAHRRQLIEELS